MTLQQEVSAELRAEFRYQRIRDEYLEATRRLQSKERSTMTLDDLWACVRAITVWEEEGRP